MLPAAAFIGIIAGAVAAKAESHFYESIRDLPPGQRADLIAKRKEAQEKARLEAREERMHRELCDAIRATKPSPHVDVTLSTEK